MRKTPLSHLETAWREHSLPVPPCALCGKLIEGEDGEGEIVPVRLWRNFAAEEICFHPDCFRCVELKK